ncbi:MAG: hypothetical protein GTO40_20345 [Deltaproteobacteria bacterium]|nr:hypothetical protein [Deltaproteobacteria bacterium]
MLAKETEYQSLPGSGIRSGRFFAVAPTRSRLWLAKDHLLCVDNDHFTENYRRFYYKDIQAISIRKTYRWETWSILLVVLALLTAGLAHLLGDSTLLWTVEGVFCVFLVINLLRGPSCMCHLYTQVHTEELSSLGRLKNALRTREHLIPRIQSVQGSLSGIDAEEFPSKVVSKRAEASRSSNPGSRPHLNARTYRGGAHRFLFALLLCAGLVNLILLQNHRMSVSILNIALGVGLLVSVIVAIVRQYEVPIRTSVRSLTWVTLAFTTSVYVVGMVRYMMVTLSNPNIAANQWELLKIYATPAPVEAPILLGLRVVYVVVSLALAVPGLLLSWNSVPGGRE